MAHENVIEMRDITKVFGEFVANDKINLHLRKGEIHALLGENGAGKSTLMNMLAGLLEPTSGEIVVNGQVVNLDSPSKAASLGIGMVHQHFMLVEAFTVAENIILGSELTKNGVLDIAGASKEIKALSERYGLSVDPSAKVADISVGTLYLGSMISLSSVTASIAAVIGVLLFPLFGFILSHYDPLFIAINLALASLIIIRHQDNIARIKNKTENLVPWGLNLTHQHPKK